MQVVTHFFDSQCVAFVTFQRQFGAAQLVGTEHGANFGLWVRLSNFEVGEFAVSVGDEVVDQFVQHFVGATGFDGHRLAQGKEVALCNEA